MEGNLAAVHERLSRYGQAHVLQYFGELSEEEKSAFIQQLKDLDFELISSLYTTLYVNPRADIHSEIQPYTNVKILDELSPSDIATYRTEGLGLVAQGKIGLLMFAGGQATRLAVPYPKGMYDVGLLSHKTLFQLFAERLIRLRELASRATGGESPAIPFVLMTNTETKGLVSEYFAANNFFGMDPSALYVFAQDMLPPIDFEGKILLSEKGKVGLSPNGNGGVFESLAKSGALEWLDRRGAQYVHLCGVDNVLLKVCDPLFLGIAHSEGVEIATKAVEKNDPTESVGALGLKGGHLSIVEYSELSAEMRELKDDKGRLVYGYGNIINHIIQLDFIKRVVNNNLEELRGLYHMAQKKIPHVQQGALVKPEQSNGLKFELFYFDVLPLSNSSVALIVKRHDEFAPVKNLAGEDSAESARELLAQLHTRWIGSAGGALPQNGREGCFCEIAPLLSYEGEDLEGLVSGELVLPLYLN